MYPSINSAQSKRRLFGRYDDHLFQQRKGKQCLLHLSLLRRTCNVLVLKLLLCTILVATTPIATIISMPTATATRIIPSVSLIHTTQRRTLHDFFSSNKIINRISQQRTCSSSSGISSSRRNVDPTLFLLLRGGGGDDDPESDTDDTRSSRTADSSTTTSTATAVVTETETTSNPTEIMTSSTNDDDEDEVAKKDELHYYIQQQLYLQSRSLQLRQALIQRGIHALAHTSTTTTTSATSGGKKKVVDWECALSTEEYPKSCLYSLDAEYGQKVIAPMLPEEDDDEDDENEEGSTTTTTKARPKKNKKYEWITISSLNRLYRTDPNKVEPLWYDQYAILSTWFSRSSGSGSPHPYSLYTHFSHNLYATLITTALNVQPAWMISVVLIGTILTASSIVFYPVLESGMTLLLTSSLLWNNWPTWSRFTTHAALPVQLLMVQILFGLIQQGIQSVTHHIRTILIDEECRLLQNCIPLTIIEGRSTSSDAADNTDVEEDEEENEVGVDEE